MLALAGFLTPIVWRRSIGVKIETRPAGPLQANFYLVYEDGAGIVIDPGGDPELIMEIAGDAGVDINAIFITHGHADHLAAAPELAAATGAPICASAEAGEVLVSPEIYSLFPGMPKVTPAKVDRILSDGDSAGFAGLTVAVVATPGHSPGSLTYFTGGALFPGDLLFHGSVGRTDLPGGSFEQLAASVKKLVSMFPPDTMVYPGHGNATTLKQEKENNIFLADLDW